MTSRRAQADGYTAPRLRVAVTQDIIDSAVPKDSGHCMIAEAIAAAYPTATWISVDLATIRFTDEAAGYRYIYLTPRPAQAALLDFDQGVTPQPFHFVVTAAQIVASGGGRRGQEARLAKLRNTDPATGEAANSGEHAVPVKAGGKAPPSGALAATRDAKTRREVKNVAKVGRRREFGLRAIIR